MNIFTIALLLSGGTAALAQSLTQSAPAERPSRQGQGTDREHAACHPDVVRFCRHLLKDNQDDDVFAILDCLQTHRARISAGCRAVLDGHGV